MRSTTSRKWSKKDDEYIKANLAQGTIALATRFNVSPAALRKRVFGLGLSLKKPKEVIIKPTKANSLEKFNPSHHKIKNSSTVGKIPLYIKSERMTVYIKPDADVDAVINKYATRHKPIT
jgi:hypothetical protein